MGDQQQSPQVTFTASRLTAGSSPLICAGMAGVPVIASGKPAAVLSRAGQAGCPGVTSGDSSITAERTAGLATWFVGVTTTTADHTSRRPTCRPARRRAMPSPRRWPTVSTVESDRR